MGKVYYAVESYMTWYFQQVMTRILLFKEKKSETYFKTLKNSL